MYIHMYVTFGICLIKIWEIAMTPSRTTVEPWDGNWDPEFYFGSLYISAHFWILRRKARSRKLEICGFLGRQLKNFESSQPCKFKC